MLLIKQMLLQQPARKLSSLEILNTDFWRWNFASRKICWQRTSVPTLA